MCLIYLIVPFVFLLRVIDFSLIGQARRDLLLPIRRRGFVSSVIALIIRLLIPIVCLLLRLLILHGLVHVSHILRVRIVRVLNVRGQGQWLPVRLHLARINFHHRYRTIAILGLSNAPLLLRYRWRRRRRRR